MEDKIRELDVRLTKAEKEIAEHSVDIKVLNKSHKEIHESQMETKAMVQAIHKRMDKLRDQAITPETLKVSMIESVPEIVNDELQKSLGQLVYWIVGTAVGAIVINIAKDLV